METYKKQMKNVPFGMSIFQIKILCKKESPQREYRHCLLQLNQKINALNECKFRRDRIQIDMEEIDSKLETATNFEKRRLEIDKKEKQYRLDEEIKLIEDALIEIETYKHTLKGLPEYTREEYEKSELQYWKEKFLSDMKHEMIATGMVSKDTVEQLEKVGVTIGKNTEGKLTITENTLQDGKYNEILCLNKTNLS